MKQIVLITGKIPWLAPPLVPHNLYSNRTSSSTPHECDSELKSCFSQSKTMLCISWALKNYISKGSTLGVTFVLN